MTSLRCSIDPDAPIARALARGPALLDAVRDGVPRLSVALTRGEAVVLGSRQRAGRVVDLTACARVGFPVLRRATTGTAATLRGNGLVWTLALPRVDALLPDATLRTLLNRNVRLLLSGLTRTGATAGYFGREWVAVRHCPAAVLGYDITDDGRALVEAIIGWSNDLALPKEMAAPEELVLDRWRMKQPVALGRCVGEGWSPLRVAETLVAAAAERAGVTREEEPLATVTAREAVRDGNDPVPAGMRVGPLVSVPIGYVEAAQGEGGRWYGGDALASNAWLDARGRGDPNDGPLEGAQWEDFEAALG
jgi:hypothetical protein